MLDKNSTKKEIEDFLVGKGDFVAIDHLDRLIKNRDLATDKKKFVYEKLAKLYAKKRMFREASKMYDNCAILSHTFRDKQEYHVKEAELCIRALRFDLSDEALKKATGEANLRESAEIYVRIKELYKSEGERLLKENKKGQAMKIYEKMLELRLTDEDRAMVKEKLMKLYESLGRVREYFKLRDGKR